MDQPRAKTGRTQYSFFIEDRPAAGPGSLTLLQRSKRVLGDIDLGEASMPTESDPSSSELGANKRREQVRKAQRTHRQRTQGYIKELENEVLRLRDAEKQAIHKVAKLQQDVNLLLAILTKHSIPTPPGIVNQSSQPGKEERYVELHPLPNPIAAMVNLKDLPCSESCSNYTPPAMTMSSRSEAASPMLSSTIYTSDVSDSLPSSLNHVQPTLFEDPRVGIDFVLALERPCLPHLRESHLDYNDRAELPAEQARLASGHVFTASLQLWQPSPRERYDPETYAISMDAIQRLLTISLNIGVKDDELTPVQIWNLMKHFEVPEGQKRQVLERLTEEISKHVECLHFGAVVGRDKLEKIFQQYLLKEPIVF